MKAIVRRMNLPDAPTPTKARRVEDWQMTFGGKPPVMIHITAPKNDEARKIGQEKTQSRRKISDEVREQIAEMFKSGMKAREIADQLDMKRNTVCHIWARWREEHGEN